LDHREANLMVDAMKKLAGVLSKEHPASL
jgi:hypothetical protein